MGWDMKGRQGDHSKCVGGEVKGMVGSVGVGFERALARGIGQERRKGGGRGDVACIRRLLLTEDQRG